MQKPSNLQRAVPEPGPGPAVVFLFFLFSFSFLFFLCRFVSLMKFFVGEGSVHIYGTSNQRNKITD